MQLPRDRRQITGCQMLVEKGKQGMEGPLPRKLDSDDGYKVLGMFI